MVIKVAGQEYRVTNNKQKRNSKSHSLDDLTTTTTATATAENNNSEEVKCKNTGSVEEKETQHIRKNECCDKNYALAKSKSEGNPFEHKKRGKIKRLAQRPAAMGKLHEFNVDRFYFSFIFAWFSHGVFFSFGGFVVFMLAVCGRLVLFAFCLSSIQRQENATDFALQQKNDVKSIGFLFSYETILIGKT